MKTSLTYANFMKALTGSKIGNTHGKPKIVPTSHKFTKWLPLVASIDPLLASILAIRVWYSFPTHFKVANMLIHLIFTF